LTDYSDFIKQHPESSFKGFENGVESIWISTKGDTPVTTWAHTPEDKVTVVYTPFLTPGSAAE
jgi:hypothetical protein